MAAAPASARVIEPPFSAAVDLDVTALRRRLTDEAGVTAAIIARLLAACRSEGLLDADSPLCVLRPTSRGVLGVLLGEAASLSARGIAAGLSRRTPGIPAITPATLTVVDLSGTRVAVTGDWGYGGRGVATLGASVPTVTSHRPEPGPRITDPGVRSTDPGLGLAERAVARLSFTVPAPDAHAAVRVLDALARPIGD